MGLSSQFSMKFSAQLTGGNAFGGPEFDPNLVEQLQFMSGTLSDQADLLYIAERAFTASSADTIDLTGTLKDALGNNYNAAEVVGIVIANKSKAGVRNTVALSVGAGTNPWFGMFGATGDVLKIPPGGLFALFGPDANGLGTVTAATADILTVTPGAAAGAYQVAILGRSA